MATGSQVNVAVNVNTTGLKEANKDAGQLHSSLKGAAEAAQKVRVPGATAAAREAVKAESRQYGVARGTVGTGAEGRDFAKQSQGLGGLVRLYATYAANLFAVGAAFRALSSAMDTANMVKGLDQLGARSGMALGSISKQLMAATDNAISFRDAMSATAKVTAAGLGGDTVLRLGKAAKSAAQALGLDIGDAVSRLSRGITKLEPELLDELGIFIRIDDVVQKYATSVGKSSTAITDFEKRTAVANAVLTQAEQKFGAIKIDANPYNQLSASIQNLTQNILELVNKVLGPLMNTLASSPTALLTALSGIGLVLVKQALPALGQFKAGLQDAADKAQEISISKAADALKARETINKQIEAKLGDSLDKQVDRVDAAQNKIDKLQLNTAEKGTKAYRALSKNIHEITETDIAVMQRRANVLEKQGQVNIAQGYREAIPAILAAQKGEADLNALRESNARSLEKDSKGWTTYGLNVQAARNAEVAATRSAIISNAAYRGSLIGITGAYTLMRQEIDKTDLTKFQKRLTIVQGTIAGFFGKLGTLLGRLGRIGEIAALAIGAFTLLNSALTNNSKETAKFTSDIDSLSSAVSNSTEVLKTYSKLDYSASFQVDIIKASSTATNELNTGIKALAKSLREVEESAGIWDKFINNILKVVGKDVASTASKNMASAIASSIRLAPTGPATEAYKKKISEILKVDYKGKDSIIEALSKTKSAEEFKQKLDELAKASSEFSTEQSIAAAKVLELDSAFANTNTAFLALTNSFSNTSPLQKFGLALQAESDKISAALQTPEKGFANLTKLVTDTNRLTLFSPETFSAIKSAAPEIEAIGKKIQEQTQIIADRKVDLENERNEFTISELKGLIVNAEKEIDKLKTRGKEISQSLLSAIKQENFVTAGKIMGQEIAAAGVQASLTIRKAYAGFLTGEAAIKENTKIAVAEIRNRSSLIQATLDLVKSNYALQATNQKNLAYSQMTSDKATPEQSEAAARDFLKYSAQETVLTSKDPLKTAKEYSPEQVGELEAKLQSLAGMQKQLMQNNAEIASQYIVEVRELGVQAGREYQKVLDRELALKQAKLDQLSAQEQLTGEINTSSIKQRQKLQDDIADLEYAKQTVEAYGRLVGLSSALQKLEKQPQQGAEARTENIKQTAELRAEVTKEVTRLQELAAVAEEKRGAKTLRDKKEILDEELKGLTEAAALSQAYRDLEDKATQARFDRESKGLELLSGSLQLRKELGIISAEDLIKETTAIKLLEDAAAAEAARFAIKQQSTQTVKAAQLELDKLEKIKEVNGRLTADQQDQYYLQSAIKNQTEANASAAIASIDAQLAARKQLTISSAEHNIQLERQNELMQQMVGLTETLSTAFGDFGTALGNTTQALLKMATDEENFTKRKIQLQQEAAKFNEGSDPQEVARNVKAQEKLEKDRSKSELNNITAISAAGKKMFGEKTAAYKILNGIEKANSIMSLALQAKEVAATISNTAKLITESIPGIYATAMKQLGPVFGPVAATAAIAAFVGSAFGGRSSTVDMTGQTASERQASQGTGTVTGDSSAKSQSIANSLNILNATTVQGLSYSNRMVDLLTDIKEGITGVAQSVYGVVGLTTGSAFNTKEGTTGFNILGGLLGRTSSKEITDTGLAIKGTFANLMTGGKEFVRLYEDVLTTTKNSILFISWSNQTLGREYLDLDDAVRTSISRVFTNAKDLFVEAGASLGMTQQSIMDKLSTIDLSVNSASLRGLKGAELEEALNSIFSSMLDKAAGVVFTQLKEFNKYGEGMLETAIRVTDGLSKVNLAMQSLNKDSIGSGVAGIRISEALIKASGGLDKFISKTESFASKFLTEDERIISKQAAVNKELTRLGYASNMTKQQFKDLITGFKVVDTYTANVYSDLLDLGDSIYEIGTAAETTAEKTKAAAKALADAKLDQSIRIYELLGNSEEALRLTRQKQLDSLDEALRPGQVYINALEDEKSLKDKLINAYNTESTAIKSTITSLKASIKTLKDYKTALTAGSLSTLSPTEKYLQSKARFQDLVTAAKAVITSTSSKEEIDARDKAVSELSGASDSFLNSSRELFASSQQYTQDFDLVTGLLETTTVSLTDQETTAQRSLNALEDSVAELMLIKTSTQTAADLISQLLTAQGLTDIARQAYHNSLTTTTIGTADTISTAITTSNTQVTGAVSTASTANDAVTNAAATTVANAVTGTTAAVNTSATTISNAIINPTTADGARDDINRDPTGWGTMTDTEKTAYFAANPVARAIDNYMMNFTSVGLAAQLLGAPVLSSDAAIGAYNASITGSNARAQDAYFDPSSKAGAYSSTSTDDNSDGFDPFGGLGALGGLAGFDREFAEGGYVTPGLALVGERGPELVDFKTPGRVYSNRASNGLLNNDDLIAEIRALRQEVTQLRQEQREQTGHLITTNYDANQLAAKQIALATQDASDEQAWRARSAVKIA